ncbi:MAG: 3-octaprenyl-4-hydroxybenzoate carboxy-lyase, partial [Singulisphaera sp.]
AAGPAIRELPTSLPRDLHLPAGFDDARIALPGVLAVRGPRHEGPQDGALRHFCAACENHPAINTMPLVVLVDDSDFAARSLNNLLWVTFTRSNPAADIDGIGATIEAKHWGCSGSLVIDARVKPHHAPPLVEDAEITRRVDRLGAPGGPLHGII